MDAILRAYLDTSVYNRPFDDQAQARIWLETLALSVILQMIEDDEIELVASTIVLFETDRSPDPTRRKWVQNVVMTSAQIHRVDETTLQRSRILEAQGLKSLDALHVAAAEIASVEFFVTCDDRLIKRYRSISSRSVWIGDPTEFVRLVQSAD